MKYLGVQNDQKCMFSSNSVFFSNLFCFFSDDFQTSFDLPSLQDSITTPMITTENRSILLTCVVRNLGNYTLLWKKGVSTVLTAGAVRISADQRYNVIHDEGLLNSKMF